MCLVSKIIAQYLLYLLLNRIKNVYVVVYRYINNKCSNNCHLSIFYRYILLTVTILLFVGYIMIIIIIYKCYSAVMIINGSVSGLLYYYNIIICTYSLHYACCVYSVYCIYIYIDTYIILLTRYANINSNFGYTLFSTINPIIRATVEHMCDCRTFVLYGSNSIYFNLKIMKYKKQNFI